MNSWAPPSYEAMVSLLQFQAASDLNINPGGGVMSRALNWRHMKRIPADLRARLLSKEEVDTRLEVLGN